MSTEVRRPARQVNPTVRRLGKHMKNISTEDLIDELISASYESGYYALNQKELVSAAVTKRRNARRELERRLAPKSQDHMTTEPKFVHSPGYPQDESEFSEIERLRTPEIPLPEA